MFNHDSQRQKRLLFLRYCKYPNLSIDPTYKSFIIIYLPTFRTLTYIIKKVRHRSLITNMIITFLNKGIENKYFLKSNNLYKFKISLSFLILNV